MDREEYRLKVLNFVHQLRVDPHDEVTRLVLADFMEENSGRVGVGRTTAVLRSGLMVPNSLDMDAMLYAVRSLYGLKSLEEAFLGRLDVVYTQHYGRLRTGMSPVDYHDLWLLVFRYRLAGRCPEEVIEEAGLVYAERRERGLSLLLTSESHHVETTNRTARVLSESEPARIMG